MTLADFFHDLEITNLKTGTSLVLTQIAPTVEEAIEKTKRYNFAGLDFENDYSLTEAK